MCVAAGSSAFLTAQILVAKHEVSWLQLWIPANDVLTIYYECGLKYVSIKRILHTKKEYHIAVHTFVMSYLVLVHVSMRV